MNINFENRFEKPIPFQQVSSTKVYYKVFEENGLTKKKEEHEKNIIVKILYYIGNNETEQQAISYILDTYSSLHYGFEIRTRENINNYIKEVHRFFSSSGVYEDFCEILLFNQNILIYEKEENTLNGVTDVNVRKYYKNQETNEEYEFLYKSNGELLAMRGGVVPPFVAENDYSISVEEIDFFFPNFLNSNPYYSNHDFLPIVGASVALVPINILNKKNE